MQSIKLTRQSPYTARQMFDLITDVDRYDELAIPYCTAPRVRQRSGTEIFWPIWPSATNSCARRYTSKIALAETPLTETVKHAKGPFRHLFNEWVFVDTEDGCEVQFTLQFEFAVPMLRRVIQPIMGKVVERFVAAFEDRARQIYG